MTDMKMVFNEWYGELSYAQQAAYRKHNVSPSDHDALVELFGNDHARITRAVKENCGPGGLFSVFQLWDNEVHYKV